MCKIMKSVSRHPQLSSPSFSPCHVVIHLCCHFWHSPAWPLGISGKSPPLVSLWSGGCFRLRMIFLLPGNQVKVIIMFLEKKRRSHSSWPGPVCKRTLSLLQTSKMKSLWILTPCFWAVFLKPMNLFFCFWLVSSYSPQFLWEFK